MIEHLLDRFAQFALFVDAACFHAEALGDGHEVGVNAGKVVGAADIRFIAEDRVAADAAVEAVFPLYDHAEVLVVKNHRFRRDLLNVGGGEFLDVHHP